MSPLGRLTCVAVILPLLSLADQGALSAQEVRSRGPVHEAFAQPPQLDAKPGATIPREPPPAVVELLPQQRPDGANIRWIPGYWSWDAAAQDYVWVTGVFRQPPPGRQYVPGYWTRGNAGWRRVPGFWAAKGATTDLTYVPEPPASKETGPQESAPNRDSIYQPGSWRYQDKEYQWQPGSWTEAVDSRVWVAPRYLWTPDGYVFVDGYQDYPLAQRGQLFAPVAFKTRPANLRVEYALDVESILNNLFFKPGSSEYVFGDYFTPEAIRAGYQPWFAGPGQHDALLGYYQWQHRNDTAWTENLQQSYDDRASGRVPPPLQILEGQNSEATPNAPTIAQVPPPNAIDNANANAAAAQAQQGQGFNPFNPLMNPGFNGGVSQGFSPAPAPWGTTGFQLGYGGYPFPGLMAGGGTGNSSLGTGMTRPGSVTGGISTPVISRGPGVTSVARTTAARAPARPAAVAPQVHHAPAPPRASPPVRHVTPSGGHTTVHHRR